MSGKRKALAARSQWANPAALRKLMVRPQDTLMEALGVIDRGAVELVFVADKNGKIVGTLSDGDARRAILRGVALNKAGVVAKIMRKNFRSVGPEVHRQEVLDLMRASSISQVPVLDANGRMIGLHLMHELIGAVERPNRAVIMAGGKGVRLRPLTENTPKPMLTVAGRPILERIVLHLVGYGIREIFLAINYLGEVIEEHFGDGSAFGCHIRYLRERKPLGTGGALSLLPKSSDHPTLVMNGDLVTEAKVDQILDFHERTQVVATCCLRPYQMEVPFGVAELDGDRLVSLREKPTQHMLVNAGIYAFSPAALHMVPRGQDYPITRLLEECLSKRLPVGAHVLEGDWMDIGRHEELRRARGL